MALECEKNKLKLLKIELPDRYVQENFKRIENHAKDVCQDLKTLELGAGGGGDTNNYITVNGAWTKHTESINASSTKVIESITLTNNHSFDYVITLFNDVEGKAKRYYLTALKDGAIIRDTVYSRLGSLTDISINAAAVGGNLELELTNNNTFGLSISYARLIL